MNPITKKLLTGLAVVALAAMLPLVGSWLRDSRSPGCELDGMAINSFRRVRIIDQQGRPHLYCSIKCAELWLEASKVKPRAIHVTDEQTGTELELADAYFVRSVVVSHGPTRDRRHAFQSRNDAEAHARDFRGQVLSGADRPFSSEAIPIKNSIDNPSMTLKQR